MPAQVDNTQNYMPEEDQSIGNDRYHIALVESAVDYPFNERLTYFLSGGPITKSNRQAVELCVLGEAGRIVSRDKTSRLSSLKRSLVQEYSIVMKSLDSSLFQNNHIRDDMCTRLFGGRQNSYGEKKMWEMWTEMKTEMKKIFSNLPTTYHKMRSGIQLYNVYDKVVRDHWKEDFVSVMLDVNFLF